MKAVLFGSGHDLHYYGHLFRNTEIVDVLDNDKTKQGTYLPLSEILNHPVDLIDTSESCEDIICELRKARREVPGNSALSQFKMAGTDETAGTKEEQTDKGGRTGDRDAEMNAAVKILAPEDLPSLTFDKIFLCSNRYYLEMAEQLERLEVPFYKVVLPFEIAFTLGEQASPMPEYFIDTRAEVPQTSKNCGKSVYLFSHMSNHTGASIALWHLGTVLRDQGYEVTFVSGRAGALYQELNHDGIRVLTDPDIGMLSLDQLPYVEKIDFAIINTAFLGNLLRSHQRVKNVFWWLHEPSFMYNVRNTETCRLADLQNADLWFVSEAAKKKFFGCRSDVGRYRMLPFYVDDPKESQINDGGISLSNRRKNTNDFGRPQKTLIGMAGTICSNKNQTFFVQCVNQLPEGVASQCEFLIVGQGKRSELGRINNTDKTHRITILSPMDRNGMNAFYSQLSALVCCSHEETFSSVCVEALSYGIPCILFDSIPVASYLRDRESALIVPADDEQPFTAAMEWLIQNPDEAHRIGANGRKVYERFFTKKVFTERVSALLKNTKD